jgi:uncharacterized protein DUF3237
MPTLTCRLVEMEYRESKRSSMADRATHRPLRAGDMFFHHAVLTRSEDGALIYMTSFGVRHGPAEALAALARGEVVDPSSYYFRTAPRFETSAPQYAFLNRLIAIASGDRRASGPIYRIEEVL